MKKRTPTNDFVADARTRAGMTQNDLASRLSVTRRYISQLETGTRQPSKRILAALQQIMIECGQTDAPYSPTEIELLQMFRQLSTENQKRITGIVRSLAEVPSAVTGKSTGIKPRDKILG